MIQNDLSASALLNGWMPLNQTRTDKMYHGELKHMGLGFGGHGFIQCCFFRTENVKDPFSAPYLLNGA